MTCEFNVDRFYAQLGAFSIFVILHERGVKMSKKWQGMCHLDDTALSSIFFLLSTFQMTIANKQINQFWWNFVTMTSGHVYICDKTFDLVGVT